jgi:hypothetical protein
MVSDIDAELVDWALVRVAVGEQVSTHAVGLRTRHLDLEAAYVLTSPVQAIDREKHLLRTQNSVYELVNPVDSYPDDELAHWALLVVNRAKAAPDRIEWIKADGSVGKWMDRAEIVATVAAWRRGR